ncbi:MAG: epoxide hydrolase [Acidobacteriota bacterium]|nr:epoxide hydrolase [Acidobacteriota bacterium]
MMSASRGSISGPRRRRWSYRLCRRVTSMVGLVLVSAAVLGAPVVLGRESRRIGAESQLAEDPAIRPFEIAIDDDVLTDLRERLLKARMPDEPEGVGWALGMNQRYLTQLVAYWRDEFDWFAQQRRLNQWDHFTTDIDGLEIHFIHQRSPEPGAFPLILTPGWPGTFAEFSKVIGPLTDPVAYGGRAQDAFHLVIPSIPGYGFSERPPRLGYGRERTAAIFATLMARLGYERYGAQGGDLGAGISRQLAIDDADRVAGLHLNLCAADPPDPNDPTEGVPPAEVALMEERAAFWTDEERGYSHMHGTKPQTLGYSLNDSPVGLAAWIVEKYRSWCDCDGNPETKFSKDELLTTLTIYWVTETATSAARYYYEGRHSSTPPSRQRVEVPTACAAFPGEFRFTPRRWLEARYNLTRFTMMPSGGHFAASEEPELYVDDLRAFFRSVR